MEKLIERERETEIYVFRCIICIYIYVFIYVLYIFTFIFKNTSKYSSSEISHFEPQKPGVLDAPWNFWLPFAPGSPGLETGITVPPEK